MIQMTDLVVDREITNGSISPARHRSGQLGDLLRIPITVGIVPVSDLSASISYEQMPAFSLQADALTS